MLDVSEPLVNHLATYCLPSSLVEICVICIACALCTCVCLNCVIALCNGCGVSVLVDGIQSLTSLLKFEFVS